MVAAVCFVLASACGGEGLVTEPETLAPGSNPSATVASVQVTPSQAELTPGHQQTVEAHPRDADGNELPGEVSWTSTNTSVVRVEVTGEQSATVTAISEGDAEVVASMAGVDGSFLATVDRPDGGTVGPPGRVLDLRTSESSDNTVVLEWTEVGDGAGSPARYAVRYGSPTVSWGSAFPTERVAEGDRVGTGLTLEVDGLDPETDYEFQLVAFRGTLNQNAVFGDFSNVAPAATSTLEGTGGGGGSDSGGGGGGSSSGSFVDDFDAGHLASDHNGFGWLSGHGSVSSAHARSGSHSMAIVMPASGTSNTNRQQNFRLPDVREVWIEYWMRVPENYDHQDSGGSNNNKFLQLWDVDRANEDVGVYIETEYAGGGGSWFRVLTDTDRDIALPVGNTLLKCGLFSACSGDVIRTWDRGRWIRLRYHFAVSTWRGANDGVIEIWKDDAKIVSQISLDLYSSSDGNMFFRRGRLLGAQNSGWGETTTFYFDDFRIHLADPGW